MLQVTKWGYLRNLSFDSETIYTIFLRIDVLENYARVRTLVFFKKNYKTAGNWITGKIKNKAKIKQSFLYIINNSRHTV